MGVCLRKHQKTTNQHKGDIRLIFKVNTRQMDARSFAAAAELVDGTPARSEEMSNRTHDVGKDG